MENYSKQLEAILFAAGRSVTIKNMCDLLKITNEDLIHNSLLELKQKLIEENSPLSLFEEIPGAWKLSVIEEYQPIVSQIVPHTELSKTVLETLAVIAWKQPIFQSEVIAVRTNKGYKHIDDLERIGFINKKKDGKTYKLSLTQKFFDYFNLSSTEELNGLFSKNKIPSTGSMNKIFQGPYTGSDPNLGADSNSNHNVISNNFNEYTDSSSNDSISDISKDSIISSKIPIDKIEPNIGVENKDNVSIMQDMASLLSKVNIVPNNDLNN